MANSAGWNGNSQSFKIAQIVSGSQANSATFVQNVTSCAANSFLVCTMTESEDSSKTNDSVASSPVLVWTRQSRASAASSGNAAIYTATFAAGGNITITYTWGVGGSMTLAGTCYEFNNGESTPGGASPTPTTGLTVANIVTTTTRINNYIVIASCDWNGKTPSNPYNSFIAVQSFVDPTSSTHMHYYRQVDLSGNPMRFAIFSSTGTNMSAGTCAYEVRQP